MMLAPIKSFKPIKKSNDNNNVSRKRARSSPISPENLMRLSPENKHKISKNAEQEEKEELEESMKELYFKEYGVDLTEEDILQNKYDTTKYFVKKQIFNNEYKPFSEETAYLLKDIFQSDKSAKNFLSPLLFQFFKDNIVYQVYDGTAKDLSLIDKKTYLENRATIEKTLFDAIKYLHNKNILHRDITPDNIVWDDSSKRAKLIDLDLLVKIQPNTVTFIGQNSFGTIPRRGEKINSFNRHFTKNRNIYGAEISLAILNEFHGLEASIKIPENIKRKYNVFKGGMKKKSKTRKNRKV